MTDGDIIDVPDLPPNMRFSAMRPSGLDRTLAEVEAEYIKNVLPASMAIKRKLRKFCKSTGRLCEKNSKRLIRTSAPISNCRNYITDFI